MESNENMPCVCSFWVRGLTQSCKTNRWMCIGCNRFLWSSSCRLFTDRWIYKAEHCICIFRPECKLWPENTNAVHLRTHYVAWKAHIVVMCLGAQCMLNVWIRGWIRISQPLNSVAPTWTACIQTLIHTTFQKVAWAHEKRCVCSDLQDVFLVGLFILQPRFKASLKLYYAALYC